MSALIHLIRKRRDLIIKFNKLSSKNNLLTNLKQDNVIFKFHKLNYSTRLANKNSNSLLKIKGKFVNYKSIRTTNPNRLPPIFWLIIRPVLNFVAILGGRKARLWWRNLPVEKKNYLKQKLRANKKAIWTIIGALTCLCSIYYLTHLEETPITNRKRFLAINKDKINELSKIQFEAILKAYESKLLPNTHPFSKRVERIATKIIKSNLDIPEFREKTWTVSVIDRPDVKNAMVAGDGKIFVFTGMLNLCDTDDSLGFVLSHEIAHSILSHTAEILSFSDFIGFFVAMGIFFIWSIFPTDISALIASYLTDKLIEILFQLPFTRRMEIEADKVAMLFAAKSCFDVREGVAFWLKMDFLEKQNLLGVVSSLETKELDNKVEFLSTHPTHTNRADYLHEMLEETLKLREQCNCPRLPYRNPIESIKRIIKHEEGKRKPEIYSLIRID